MASTITGLGHLLSALLDGVDLDRYAQGLAVGIAMIIPPPPQTWPIIEHELEHLPEVPPDLLETVAERPFGERHGNGRAGRGLSHDGRHADP